MLYKLQGKEWLILGMLFGAKKARECREIVLDAEKRVDVVGEILNEEERRSLILGDEPISDEHRRRRELNLRSRHIMCKACFGKSDPVSFSHILSTFWQSND